MQVLRSLNVSFGEAQPRAHQEKAFPVKGWKSIHGGIIRVLVCAALALLVWFCVYVALAGLELVI